MDLFDSMIGAEVASIVHCGHIREVFHLVLEVLVTICHLLVLSKL